MKLKTLILLLITVRCFAQTPGMLDASFGNGGKVITNVSGTNDRIFGIAIQADGKIITGGSTQTNLNLDFCIARYLTDGSLDSTFGNNGVSITPIGTSNEVIRNIALQPDGKIITIGETNTSINNSDIVIVRYLPSGVLDNSFGNGGIQITAVSGGNDFAYSVLLDATGLIYVGGHNYSNATIIRYTANGILDSNFNGNGIFNFVSGPTTYINPIAMQGNKIIAAGSVDLIVNADYMLTRIDTNAFIDTTFGNNGVTVTDFSNSNEQIKDIIILSDYKIVAGGSVDLTNNFDWDFALAKYNMDGSIDSTFGINGKVITAISNDDDVLTKIILQPDGKIIATGYVANTINFALVRYNADGSLDNTFGNNGIVISDFAGNDDIPYTLALQNDYKILAAGTTRTGINNYKFALARYFSGLNVGVVDFEKQPLPIQTYPNPVINYATLTYTLPVDENITIKLFDIAGKEIKTFMQANKKQKGEQTEYLFFDDGIKAGVYFLSIGNGGGVQSVKVVKN